ncbi:hypothetical protein [Bacteroides sp. 519]|uniref:hypothetical protein n=1 Tax=Bacteroides sp. 519 TaxID=2302937 RepID=UPI0013D14082|nr:hypothetical protein [Bacteroides sp. 519]NDV59318.1 hypothetical protein [Bacteroides sp. 519]
MNRCVNIDWLQLYCIAPGPPQLVIQSLTHQGYTVNLRKHGTRHFRMLYDVCTTDSEPYLEVQADPFSLKSQGGIFLQGAMLIKLSNKFCYEQNAVSKLCDLLLTINIEIKSISRLDIACDFQYFDNGMKPSTLIRRFLKNELWKIGVTKFTLIANQSQNNISPEYLRFGSGNSAASVYLYNKTKELTEVKEKPWIRDAWSEMGYTKPDVWRLELSLKCDARHMIQYEDTVIKTSSGWYNQNTGEVFAELGTLTKGTNITQNNNRPCYKALKPIWISHLKTLSFVYQRYTESIHKTGG